MESELGAHESWTRTLGHGSDPVNTWAPAGSSVLGGKGPWEMPIAVP